MKQFCRISWILTRSTTTTAFFFPGLSRLLLLLFIGSAAGRFALLCFALITLFLAFLHALSCLFSFFPSFFYCLDFNFFPEKGTNDERTNGRTELLVEEVEVSADPPFQLRDDAFTVHIVRHQFGEIVLSGIREMEKKSADDRFRNAAGILFIEFLLRVLPPPGTFVDAVVKVEQELLQFLFGGIPFQERNRLQVLLRMVCAFGTRQVGADEIYHLHELLHASWLKSKLVILQFGGERVQKMPRRRTPSRLLGPR